MKRLFLFPILLVLFACVRTESKTPEICIIKDGNLLIEEKEICHNILEKDEDIMMNFFTVYNSAIYFFSTENIGDSSFKNTLYSFSLITKKKQKQGEIIFNFITGENYKELGRITKKIIPPNENYKNIFFDSYSILFKNSYLNTIFPDNPESSLGLFDCMNSESAYFDYRRGKLCINNNSNSIKIKQDISSDFLPTGVEISSNGKFISVCRVKIRVSGITFSYIDIYNQNGVLKNSFIFSHCYDTRVSNDGKNVLLLNANEKHLCNVYLRTDNELKLIDKDCQNAFFIE